MEKTRARCTLSTLWQQYSWTWDQRAPLSKIKRSTYLQVTTNIAQQRNVAYAGDEEETKGAEEHDDGEERRHGQQGG
jgi:hypothetical protein